MNMHTRHRGYSSIFYFYLLKMVMSMATLNNQRPYDIFYIAMVMFISYNQLNHIAMENHHMKSKGGSLVI